jgi:hypothetical protein
METMSPLRAHWPPTSIIPSLWDLSQGWIGIQSTSFETGLVVTIWLIINIYIYVFGLELEGRKGNPRKIPVA